LVDRSDLPEHGPDDRAFGKSCGQPSEHGFQLHSLDSNVERLGSM